MNISPTTFREIISGERRGLGAGLLRGFLRLVEFPYTWVVQRRNSLYDREISEIHQPPLPVISVGNLTLGGTGKSPLVMWLAKYLRDHDIRVAVLSRGYGAKDGANDEALQLERNLPDVPHLENPDRVAGVNLAYEEFATQLILLDDGFQHRRLGRSADIVLLDALEPFGFEHVFPRGSLREPLSSLNRADVVMLSRADCISEAERQQVRERVRQLAPETLWAECIHAPHCLLSASGKTESFDTLKDQPFVAFCGIGNPKAFRQTLTSLNLSPIDFREYADHQPYTKEEVNRLIAWAKEQNAAALICTEKDLVKLDSDQLGGIPLKAVRIELQFITGEESFKEWLIPFVENAKEVHPEFNLES
ncbi:Tetraacyldisaccharide 4'-kinase [Planctomycetales bacterium 10988]|nr:Tetraacyldisaccharide 4'-kinase [Planctomycetales bacterium 10988]